MKFNLAIVLFVLMSVWAIVIISIINLTHNEFIRFLLGLPVSAGMIYVFFYISKLEHKNSDNNDK